MELYFDEQAIKDFEVKILAQGSCTAFIPMSFIRADKQMKVTYHVENYRKAERNDWSNPYALLNLLEGLTIKMKEAQSHLIRHERYRLDLSNIFVSAKNEEVRFAFVPYEELNSQCGSVDFAAKFGLLLNELKDCNEDFRCGEYLERIDSLCRRDNISPQMLLSRLGELKREAYLCGWENR